MAKAKGRHPQDKEPEKFEFVEPVPLPCSADETEAHVRAFIESFVVKDARPRWIELLLDRSHRLERKHGEPVPHKLRDAVDKLLGRFKTEQMPNCCSPITGTATWPIALRRVLGDERGVYFALDSAPCRMTAAEAASIAYESYAILSFEAGRRALLFQHEGTVWRCDRPRNA